MVDARIIGNFKSFADFQNEAQKQGLAQALTMAQIQKATNPELQKQNLPAPIQIANQMLEYRKAALDTTLDAATREDAKVKFNLLGQAAKTYGFDRGFEYNFGTDSPAPVNTTQPPPMATPLGADGRNLPSLPMPKVTPMTNPQVANTVTDLFGDGNSTGLNGSSPPSFRQSLANAPAPTVSVAPGFSQAGASIAADKKRAETQAQKDVELGMNPQIKTAETEATNIVAARDNYGKVASNYESGMKVLNKTLNSPGLDSNFGVKGVIPNMPGGKASDAAVLLDQIEGGAFLTAFETLKGGGQITEIEGEKATSAIVRAKRAQSAEAFRSAISDYMDVMNAGLERARQSASGEVYSKWKNPATAPKAKPPTSMNSGAKAPPRLGEIRGQYRYVGGDPAKPESWKKK